MFRDTCLLRFHSIRNKCLCKDIYKKKLKCSSVTRGHLFCFNLSLLMLHAKWRQNLCQCLLYANRIYYFNMEILFRMSDFIRLLKINIY